MGSVSGKGPRDFNRCIPPSEGRALVLKHLLGCKPKTHQTPRTCLETNTALGAVSKLQASGNQTKEQLLQKPSSGGTCRHSGTWPAVGGESQRVTQQTEPRGVCGALALGDQPRRAPPGLAHHPRGSHCPGIKCHLWEGQRAAGLLGADLRQGSSVSRKRAASESGRCCPQHLLPKVSGPPVARPAKRDVLPPWCAGWRHGPSFNPHPLSDKEAQVQKDETPAQGPVAQCVGAAIQIHRASGSETADF